MDFSWILLCFVIYTYACAVYRRQVDAKLFANSLELETPKAPSLHDLPHSTIPLISRSQLILRVVSVCKSSPLKVPHLIWENAITADRVIQPDEQFHITIDITIDNLRAPDAPIGTEWLRRYSLCQKTKGGGADGDDWAPMGLSFVLFVELRAKDQDEEERKEERCESTEQTSQAARTADSIVSTAVAPLTRNSPSASTAPSLEIEEEDRPRKRRKGDSSANTNA